MYCAKLPFLVVFAVNITIADCLCVQVMYIRNYSRHKKLIGDPTSLKGWEEVFGTTDKNVVEAELRKTNIDFTWGANDQLHLVGHESAVESHPVTGEKVWFNHAQVSGGV